MDITAPAHGAFTTSSTVTVQGQLVNINPRKVADVLVNGVSVLPLGPDQTFSTSASVNQSVVFNPIVVEVISTRGDRLAERVTVIAGESVADGDFSDEGVALRITDPGLDEVEPEITSLVNIDLATLVPPGTLIVDDFCYQDSFLGCLGRVDATMSGSPPPSLSSFAIAMDAMTNSVAGDVLLNDLAFTVDVVAVTGIGFSCSIDISAATTDILGDYGLQPDAGDPSVVDVFQLGGVSVVFGSFSDNTDCDGFLGFIVEFFIGLVIDDLQNDFVKPALEGFLNTPDVEGNTPIAGAVEVALEAIEISGPIGQSIGVNLETPLFDVTEDVNGITLGSDARITASMPDPNAVDLLASYHVDEPFPTFGPLAPNGSSYDLAICISTSAFNQLLKAEIESGLLISEISEVDIGFGPFQLTAGVLTALIPSFANIDPALELKITLYPTLAPIVTGAIGPGGEIASLELGHLLAAVVPLHDESSPLLEVAIDANLGLDMDFSAGELVFGITTPAPEDVTFTVLQNNVGFDEVILDNALPALIAFAVPELADSLGSFPLPDFLGLSLGLVDIDRNGEFMSIYLDLSATP